MNSVKIISLQLLFAVLMLNSAHAQTTVLTYPSFNNTSLDALPEFSPNQWLKANHTASDIKQKWPSEAVTVPWTELALSHFIKHKMAPSRGARGLALLHVAMYDAYIYAEKDQVDVQLCVSMAAAHVLSYLFPAEEHEYLRVAYSLIKNTQSNMSLSSAESEAFQLGQFIGKHVVHYALKDGAQRGWNGKRLQWYGEGQYHGPGAWEPTGPYFYYPPDEPFAPAWKPWVLSKASEFRPQAPPVYGSKAFIKALEEVVEVDKNLTVEQRESAKFWVDGHGSVTPAGHWNQIAIGLLKDNTLSGLETAKLFMQLNVTMADTFIAAWESKYHYWYIRPVTAAKKVMGLKFKPFILTPPFPSYVSGHAATSGAAAEVLAMQFPEQSDALIAMGESAAMSRLYGGIHFRFDNDEGLALGRKVANKVINYKWGDTLVLPNKAQQSTPRKNQ